MSEIKETKGAEHKHHKGTLGFNKRKANATSAQSKKPTVKSQDKQVAKDWDQVT